MPPISKPTPSKKLVVPSQPVSGWNDYDVLLNDLERDLRLSGDNLVQAPNWQTAVVSNGTPIYPVQFCKDIIGQVHIRGALTLPAASTGYSLFTLPVGYRPGDVQVYPANTANQYSAYVYADYNGQVSVESFGTTTIYLSPPPFIAEH